MWEMNYGRWKHNRINVLIKVFKMINTEKINLLQIKDNDLVMVSSIDYTSLFYSNGKVAPTDLVITSLEKELAQIEVPEKVKESVRKSFFDKYNGVFSEEILEKMAEGCIISATKEYKKNYVIEQAISKGYLKRLVEVFGMNAQLRSRILHSYHSPLLIFGVRGEVLDLGIQRHAWKIGEVSCEDYFHSRKSEYVDVPVHLFKRMVVGPEGVRTALEATSEGAILSNYLTMKGILPE